jgi:hypothetical protein
MVEAPSKYLKEYCKENKEDYKAKLRAFKEVQQIIKNNPEAKLGTYKLPDGSYTLTVILPKTSERLLTDNPNLDKIKTEDPTSSTFGISNLKIKDNGLDYGLNLVNSLYQTLR